MSKPKRTRRRLPALHVTWADSHAPEQSRWRTPEELEEFLQDDGLIESVGVLIRETPKWLVLALSVGMGACSEVMKIPKACVVRRRKVGSIDARRLEGGSDE